MYILKIYLSDEIIYVNIWFYIYVFEENEIKFCLVILI